MHTHLRRRFHTLRNGVCLATLVLLAPALRAVDGWDAQNGGTTGGAGGSTVTTLAQLTTYAADDVARILNVSGTINLGSSNFRVGSSANVGLIKWSGNYYVSTTEPTCAPNSSSAFTPPYGYTLTAASSVKSVVTNASTGAGTH